MDKKYVVKISAEVEVTTTTEVSARRVVMDNMVLPLKNSPLGRKFEIESVTEKDNGQD